MASWWTHSLLVAQFAVFVYWFANGNPTQQVGKLWQMMYKGMEGAEQVDKFDKIFSGVDGNVQHSAKDADVANAFYNLATDFYEYGWGDSFHFGFRKEGEPHVRAIINTQNFVASKLQVGDMARVLDMGCGIGGPLRGIARATGANITGLTINQHQVERARQITSTLSPWMQARCHFVCQDYLNVKGLEEGVYDAAFYMESSLHAEDRTKTFKETYRLLKPGGRLVAMEYNLLPGWNPSDPEHIQLMQLHLHGNGAAKTPTIEEDLAMFKAAGFEVAEHFDFMALGDTIYGSEVVSWWADLQFNTRLHLLPAHPWVRHTLPYVLSVFSALGLVPEDVPKAAILMNAGGDGLSGLGKVGAITPQYYVLAIKPHE